MTDDAVLRVLLERHGQTYAQQAGIRLADRPAPLYQLQVLSLLMSARIRAGVAVSAARELFAAGCTTASRMRAASWQDRVDALGRGSYRRYDERTATQLGDGADLLIDRYGGDLRKMRGDELTDRLQEIPGIGPVGADIFLREAQGSGRSWRLRWTARSSTAPPGCTCRATGAGWPAWCVPATCPGSPPH